mgnify:CR=1 FL=1|tara:strand:+ start:11 stop:211 length:201 start_codon:yes stop_codon:yes gene_type:complete
MKELHLLAKSKVEAKCFSILFERKRLHGELAMGLSAGVSIKEGYDVLDRLGEDLKVYQYILECLKK